MKISEFLKNYNFHDCRIFNLCFDKEGQIIECDIEVNKLILVSDSEIKSNILHLIFRKATNLKSLLDIANLDDYILNFWKIKGSRNGIEIILDNDNYSTIYFNANSVDIIS